MLLFFSFVKYKKINIAFIYFIVLICILVRKGAGGYSL